MPEYRQWNKAIAEYFSAGLPAGASFYLSVDDDTLTDIGEKHFGVKPNSDYVSDFQKAVQEFCVRGIEKRVSFVSISDEPKGGRTPNCIAFLGAMVLAAHWMDSNDSAAENNYFTRLREVLGMSMDSTGRPSGLTPPAPEERLWIIFNNWIRVNGWLPSAERAQDMPRRYINYPISQALLRQGDKGRLEDKLRTQGKRNLDWEQISIWFLESAADFPTSYLRNLAEEARDTVNERFQAIIEAVYEVYLQIDWNQSAASTYSGNQIRNQRRLTAGLYRDSDPIWGTVSYFLYPRKPNRLTTQSLLVTDGENSEQLLEERIGRFRPIPWLVDPAGGKTYRVLGDSDISELILPNRDFWILIRDPYDESSGVFASWGKPVHGEPFLLLCKRRYGYQLEALQKSGLLTWERWEELSEPYNGWVEYRDCRILSTNWNEISEMLRFPIFQPLLYELQPRTRASISLRGGLRSGRQRNTWIVGYLPKLVIASDKVVSVFIIDVSQPNSPLMDEQVNPDELIELPALTPGEYSIEVLVSGKRADRRIFRVIDWEILEPVKSSESFGARVSDYKLMGGMLVKEVKT